MKHNHLIVFAVVAMLFGVVSCAKEELRPEGNDGVTFTLDFASDGATKAFSEGVYATKLQYHVYDEDGTRPKYLFSDTVDIAAGTTTSLEIPLSCGKQYSVIFWADAFGGAEGTPYTYSTGLRYITVDYSKMNASDDTRDAFYAYQEPFKVSNGVRKEVTLRRPFAQINIGTNDIEKAEKSGLTIGQYGMKVSGVYKYLYLYDGRTSTITNVDYALTDRPEEAFPYQSGTYEYLTMGYVLAGADKTLVDVTLTSDNQEDVVFAQVPVQRNFRTNIFGSLLTDATGFDVNIEAGFDGEYGPDAWNGSDETEVVPTPDEVEEGVNVYKITTAAEFAWLASYVNEGNTLARCKVLLMNDIDLGHSAWTPIGNTNGGFQGEFDGNGYSVKNLTVKDLPKDSKAGLFGKVNDGKVCNLVIDNVSISNSGLGTGVVAGEIYGRSSGVTISGVTVKNAGVTANRWLGGIAGYAYGSVKDCKVENVTLTAIPEMAGTAYDNGDKVGGIIGYAGEGTYVVDGNSVKNVHIKGYRDLGSIMGGSYYAVTNNTAEDVEIVVDQVTNYYGEKEINANEIVGRNLGNVDLSSNTYTNVTISELWDGIYATPVSPAGDVYSIRFASQLAWVAKVVNDGTNNFSGKTVNLINDIDLINAAWTPIGVSGKSFQGKFDGQNHTVSNLAVTSTAGGSAGLFGVCNGKASLNNLVIENAVIDNGTSKSGTGVLMGSAVAPVDNVTIRNANMRGNQFIGAIVGSIYGNVTNCYVENCAIESAGGLAQDFGGICGYLCEKGTVAYYIQNCTVKELTIKGGFQDVGSIVGSSYGDVLGCHAENVQMSCRSAGKFAGRFLTYSGITGKEENNTAVNVQTGVTIP